VHNLSLSHTHTHTHTKQTLQKATIPAQILVISLPSTFLFLFSLWMSSALSLILQLSSLQLTLATTKCVPDGWGRNVEPLDHSEMVKLTNWKKLVKFGKWSGGPPEEAHRRQDTAERRRRVGCAWCNTIWPSDSEHFQVRGGKFLTVAAAGYACSSPSPF